MDSDLKCNTLTCRRSLVDKAVVTTCSHIFCIDCANQLFSTAQICPACETSLTEPDDVVICSLNPSNDYKTSVLSGLSPAIILEICSRAISFYQYQIHQESSFQQAILKNVNERNAQLQKQLENVIREANSELGLLNNKIAGLERDLELERRKSRDLHESSKEKDKEYQKLKVRLRYPSPEMSSASIDATGRICRANTTRLNAKLSSGRAISMPLQVRRALLGLRPAPLNPIKTTNRIALELDSEWARA
ncbi:hypothetical protein BOTBODRAFT_101062 [Botryobasidium botryosum FD-172 SS1]|uniref:RING-type domain-containing protein n=1 Tax=Botryobasidium botryosum (strain FD-172 SS1) TaxID=930990 RepID=A0A067N9C3_BOTB1|nr:hypothetical protein BOTBODRAFT_101062 [Botryobasidium botryosum FD-172 SS1]